MNSEYLNSEYLNSEYLNSEYLNLEKLEKINNTRKEIYEQLEHGFDFLIKLTNSKHALDEKEIEIIIKMFKNIEILIENSNILNEESNIIYGEIIETIDQKFYKKISRLQEAGKRNNKTIKKSRKSRNKSKSNKKISK